jgi:hypothetical protein
VADEPREAPDWSALETLARLQRISIGDACLNLKGLWAKLVNQEEQKRKYRRKAGERCDAKTRVRHGATALFPHLVREQVTSGTSRRTGCWRFRLGSCLLILVLERAGICGIGLRAYQLVISYHCLVRVWAAPVAE